MRLAIHRLVTWVTVALSIVSALMLAHQVQEAVPGSGPVRVAVQHGGGSERSLELAHEPDAAASAALMALR